MTLATFYAHPSRVDSSQGWTEVEGALERQFRFRDFSEALAFVVRVGLLAERENHHPDVTIHWNRVTLRWWTHTAGRVTERDAELARLTDELAPGAGS